MAGVGVGGHAAGLGWPGAARVCEESSWYIPLLPPRNPTTPGSFLTGSG